ncbi:MAG: PDZ domain-containing protein, partial [Gammaproteobacteria bacterium]|nr:PDZ domain-containing protein [Gammaproteobacteria bacterium]MDX2488109.1 PDZ domain-containing protein [Gammaproteobacteria bacterium]
PFYVGRTRVGTVSSIEVMRAGKTRTVKVTIGQLPDSDMASLDIEKSSAEQNKVGLLGMNVRGLSKDEKKQLELEYGVLVESVEADSVAANAGIKQGDIILMLNKQKMKNVKIYKSTVGAMKKEKSAAVLIRRGKGSQFLVLKP